MHDHVQRVMVPKQEGGLRAAFDEAHRRYTRCINFRNGWRGQIAVAGAASFPLPVTPKKGLDMLNFPHQAWLGFRGTVMAAKYSLLASEQRPLRSVASPIALSAHIDLRNCWSKTWHCITRHPERS